MYLCWGYDLQHPQKLKFDFSGLGRLELRLRSQSLGTVPALDSWSPPPQIQLWGLVFNIQEKIAVHFHTRVYIHTDTGPAQ